VLSYLTFGHLQVAIAKPFHDNARPVFLDFTANQAAAVHAVLTDKGQQLHFSYEGTHQGVTAQRIAAAAAVDVCDRAAAPVSGSSVASSSQVNVKDLDSYLSSDGRKGAGKCTRVGGMCGGDVSDSSCTTKRIRDSMLVV
jgi:ammonia channel protein AmtB